MTKQELQYNILSQPYNREAWYTVIKQVFGATKVHLQPAPIAITANDIASSAVELGSFYTKDERLIGIYEITIKPNAGTQLARNKVGLRNLLRSIYKYDVDGALIVFTQGNKWRFSYVSETSSKTTEPKRYTYLFGEGESCRTATDRFLKLADKKYYLQDLYDAFSVEKLNKDFFTEYKNFYKRGIEHLVGTKKYYDLLHDRNKDVKDNEDKKQKPIRDFVKKLMGRLVFLHFLQKKQWLGCSVYKTEKENDDIWNNGSPNFIRELFLQYENKEQFHSACLSALFLETLNTKRKNNIAPFTLNSNACRVPYLNGGLFDTDKIDKKTGKPIEALIDFSVDFFDKLLEFFEQYNFTIDENDPYDAEVGIDPEMLGHIFENLLEDNRERGAFYTPKDIVQYMCQESLIECLKSSLSFGENKGNLIENFVRQHQVNDVLAERNNAIALNNLLAQLKICDPAIGSGAFPMGMLKELLECRRHIYPYLKTNQEFAPGAIKKQIIENNIYGVDIENGAVDIARLRFWLALVVDELRPEPLPNLDYKIMQGNSLLEQFEGIDLKFEKAKFAVTLVKDVDLFGNVINPQTSITEFLQTKQSTKEFDISQLEHTYFNSSNPEEKRQIQEQICQFEKEFIEQEANKKLHDYETDIKRLTQKLNELLALKQNGTTARNNAEQTKQQNAIKALDKKHKEIDTLQQAKLQLKEKVAELFSEDKQHSKPYFLWHLYFSDVFANGGFDIVIGNPPYVEFKNLNVVDKVEIEKVFETAKGKYDLYIPFFELPNKLLRDGGVFTYICPTRYMHRDYGKTLRRFISDKYSLAKIIDFGDGQIFENALTYTGIFIISKSKQAELIEFVKLNLNDSLSSLKKLQFAKLDFSITKNETWYFDNENDEILPKIIFETVRLEHITDGIIQGIATGKDEIFIVDENLVLELNIESEVLEKILKGKDISTWKINWNKNYVIYPYDEDGNVILEDEFIKRYPNAYNYLLSNKDSLTTRDYFNKSNKKWFELWNQRSLSKFRKDKIITLDNASKNSFALDINHFVGTTTVYSIIPKININIRFLLLLLNSRLLTYYHRKNTIPQASGFYRYQALFIKGLPIKLTTQTNEIKFETLADYLIFLNDSNNPSVNTYADNASIAPVFEDVANMMVYELYFTQHMQELGIDVLNEPEWDNYFKSIDGIKDKAEQAKIIGECYTWLQKQDNPIRNKIILSNVKSKDIIRRINATTH